MMRKRIHTTATSLSIPFLERKNFQINSANKENKAKPCKHKRQKIASVINENISELKTTQLLNNSQLIDLPKPQPVSIIKFLYFNFFYIPQLRFNTYVFFLI